MELQRTRFQRFLRAFGVASVSVALASGCSASTSSPGAANGTANEAPSDAVVDVALPAPSAAASMRLESPPAMPPVTGDVFALLPATCSRARVFLGVGALMKTTDQSVIDAAVKRALERSKMRIDPTRAKEMETQVADSKFVASLRRAAACVGDGDAFAIAVEIDPATLKGGLADTFTKLVRSATGDAPSTTTDGGVTYITPKSGSPIFAATGTTLLLADSVATLKGAITAAAGASGFAGADTNVAWFHADSGDIGGTINASGDDWVFKVSGAPGALKAKDASDADKTIEALVEKASASLGKKKLPQLAAALKLVRVGADGDRWTVELDVSKALLRDIAREAQTVGADGLRGAL